jgi:protein-disulfide isomerase
MIIGGVIGGALLLVIVVILASSNTGGDINKYDDLSKSRTADGAFLLGDPNAPFTLIEFADFRCPACQTFKPVIDEFINRHVRTGQANLEYRTFVTAGGPLTERAAHLGECAEAQRTGAFWQAYELFYSYAVTGRYNERMTAPFAQDMGLDQNQLIACIPNATQLNVDFAYAQRLGVSATPAIFYRYGNTPPQVWQGRTIEEISRLVEIATTIPQ